MPVYSRESRASCGESAQLAEQSRRADEILIVKDGPVGEALESVIALYSTELQLFLCSLRRTEDLVLRSGSELKTASLKSSPGWMPTISPFQSDLSGKLASSKRIRD